MAMAVKSLLQSGVPLSVNTSRELRWVAVDLKGKNLSALRRDILRGFLAFPSEKNGTYFLPWA